MLFRASAILCCLVAGCVRAASLTCDDGLTCPSTSRCDEIHHGCVSPDQLAKCDGQPDGTQCTSDVTVGQCDKGVCLAGCGDGEMQALEECDDGNTQDHDGCTTTCRLEHAVWHRLPDPWLPRFGHGLVGDAQRSVLVMFGGLAGGPGSTPATFNGDTWERDASRQWRKITDQGPSPRVLFGMAYDSDRKVVVLFGGFGSANNVLGDTWEYDGTSWQEKHPPLAPAARQAFAMAYNTSRHTTMLYGGSTAGGLAQNDVWEYDGSTWALVTTTGTAPPTGSSYGDAMAYDASRGHMVLLAQSDTWELADNATWTKTSGTTHPSARLYPAATFMPGRDVVVLAGGLDTATNSFANDTWEYGTSWTEVATTSAPEAFEAGALATDGNRVVLVGGLVTSGVSTNDVREYTTVSGTPTWLSMPAHLMPSPRGYSPVAYDAAHQMAISFSDGSDRDTELFDGDQWTTIPGDGTAPEQRGGHSLAYDPAGKRIILFGGGNLAIATLAAPATWAWDGAQWTKISDTGPPARIVAAMAGDEATGKVVLFGGVTRLGGTALSDTWELSGSTWTQVNAPGPAGGEGNMMTYDPVRQGLVLFDDKGDVWAYEGQAWNLVVPADAATAPPPRGLGVLVAHRARGTLLLYGGSTSMAYLNDLWELEGTAWKQLATGDGPEPAAAPGATYFEPTQTMVLLGGAAPTPFDRTWLLQWQ